MFAKTGCLAQSRTPLTRLIAGCLCLCSAQALAATLVLDAIDDFPEQGLGDAPYYAETARSALAINAADPAFRDVFAKAATTYSGVSGVFDITIMGLAELDGEAIYRLQVNDVLIGELQNPETSVDYLPIAHTFENVELTPGDVIAVQSNANSNEKVPEGTGYAYARGRWTELRLTPDGETDSQPDKVSLTANVSILSETIQIGEDLEINYAVINDSDVGAAATNVRVLLDVPNAFEVPNLGDCSSLISAHMATLLLSCPLQELPAGDGASGSIIITAVEEVEGAMIPATAIASEKEIDGSDNRASTSVSVMAETPEPSPAVPAATVAEPESIEVEQLPTSPTEPSDITGSPEPLSVAATGSPNVTVGAFGPVTVFALLSAFFVSIRRKRST